MSSQATQHHSEEPNKRVVRGIHPVIFFLSLACMLMIGVATGTYWPQIYAAVAPAFGIKASAETLDTTLLQQTYRELVANYDGKLDTNSLIQGASKGMVAAAGDKYTTFLDAQEAEQFNSDMSGSIGGGVGAQIGLRDNQVTLVKILSGTPAERSGLKAGDKVLAINDEATDGFTVDKAVTKIRGDVGTTVKLRIQRGKETKDYSVTREEITAPSVTSEVKDNIGIITVVRFDEKAAQQARKAAEQFAEDKVKGVVVDLRGNPGGYLTAARDMASIWLDNKLVVVEKQGDKVMDELRSDSDPVLEGMPTVVLVDGNSASASEILAGALQDHKAATLVGETTYGKGSVQRLVPLANGSILKVTIARWYTPNGKNITKEGITPNETVKMTEQQLRDGNDVQLKAAIARLAK